MNKKGFHKRLRELLHREPFVPFTVEFRDGRHLLVKKTPVVFDDGIASFIDPRDGSLVDFAHDQVRAFKTQGQEKAV